MKSRYAIFPFLVFFFMNMFSAYKKTRKFLREPASFLYRVELEGIEPSSAQGNHTLSTRLFQTAIFEV